MLAMCRELGFTMTPELTNPEIAEVTYNTNLH